MAPKPSAYGLASRERSERTRIAVSGNRLSPFGSHSIGRQSQYRQARVGGVQLLGLSREKIIARNLDDFSEPGFEPGFSDLWRSFLDDVEQAAPPTAHYSAKESVSPARHSFVLGDTTDESPPPVSASVRDYALFLLDLDGQIVTWY